MQSITIHAVTDAAILLLSASPSKETTTLEVKTLLRYLGFYAIQVEVSSMMEDLEEEGQLVSRVKVSSVAPSFKIFSLPREPIFSDEEEDDLPTFEFGKY